MSQSTDRTTHYPDYSVNKDVSSAEQFERDYQAVRTALLTSDSRLRVVLREIFDRRDVESRNIGVDALKRSILAAIKARLL